MSSHRARVTREEDLVPLQFFLCGRRSTASADGPVERVLTVGNRVLRRLRWGRIPGGTQSVS